MPLENGEVLTNTNDILNEWKTYENENDQYDDSFLLQCNNELNFLEGNMKDPLYQCNAQLNQPISHIELESVLQKLKNNNKKLQV